MAQWMNESESSQSQKTEEKVLQGEMREEGADLVIEGDPIEETSVSVDLTSPDKWKIENPLPPRYGEISKLLDEGKKLKARKKIEEWMKEEKKSPYPWTLGARFFCEKKRYKKCKSYAKKAIKKSPQVGEAYYWRGVAYENLGKPLEAANEFRAALYAKEGYFLAKNGLDRVTTELENPKN